MRPFRTALVPRDLHSPPATRDLHVHEAALSSLVDAESISPWARSAAAWAIQQGAVSGYELPDGTHQLVPGERIARERVATVLSNALEKGIL